jgi:hypothetical protein
MELIRSTTSEKAGSQPTPPAAVSTNPAETFSQVSSPSFPLLRKFRVHPKWKKKWSRKGKQAESEQQPEAHQIVEDEADEDAGEEKGEGHDDESIIDQQDSRSEEDYISSIDDDNSFWGAVRQKIQYFLLKMGFVMRLVFIFNWKLGFHHVLMIIGAVTITMLCK